MVVFLLLAISGLIAVLAFYSTKLKFLSPTFLSASAVSVFCGIYVICYRHINSDIGIKAFLSVILMVCATGMGEFLANRIAVMRYQKERRYQYSDLSVSSIVISKKRTYILFVLELYAAVSRFVRLFLFTVSVGNTDIFSTLRRARPYLSGALNEEYSIDLTTFDVSVISYLAEPIAYFYCFWFLYFLVIKKERRMYLILPILGDALILVSSTSRTVFLIIGTAFITSYAYWESVRTQARKINKKLIVYGFLFIVAFFIYGNVSRGESASFGIREIYGNSAAGLYGLTEYFHDPWPENALFGQRTLKPLYDLVGNTVSAITNNTVLSFYVWGYSDEDYSNLYSSLALPIHDYGIVGMFVVRLLLSFVAVRMVKCLHREKPYTYGFYLILFYVNQFVYSYLSVLIADRFYAFLTNIRLLVINIVFTYIAIRWVLKWEVIIDGAEGSIDGRKFAKGIQRIR